MSWNRMVKLCKEVLACHQLSGKWALSARSWIAAVMPKQTILINYTSHCCWVCFLGANGIRRKGVSPLVRLPRSKECHANVVILVAKLVVTWKPHLHSVTSRLAASMTSWITTMTCVLSVHATSAHRMGSSMTV